MLLKFSLLAATAALGSQYPPCPGIHQAFLSYNPASFDGVSDTSPGLPVLLMTYNSNNTARINGLTCSFPDHVSFSDLPAGECTAVSVFHAGALNYSKALAATVSSSDSELFGLITSTSSWAVQQAMSFQSQNSVALGASICQMTTHEIQFDFSFEQTLDPEFERAVSALLAPNPNYLDNIENWLEFFSRYGIALLTKATFGGTYTNLWWQDMASFRGYGSSQSSYQAQLSIMWSYVNLGGQASDTQGASADWLSSGVGNASAFTGGSCMPNEPGCSFSQWFGTLFAHPALVKASFTPLSTYIALANNSLGVGSTDAITNISAINLLRTFIVPMTEQYAADFNNINIPVPQCTDIGNSQTCASFYPEQELGTCCQSMYMPTNVEFPNVTIIQQNNAKLQPHITNDILAPASAAISASWISLASINSILERIWNIDAGTYNQRSRDYNKVIRLGRRQLRGRCWDF
jgi:hypothetical protein